MKMHESSSFLPKSSFFFFFKLTPAVHAKTHIKERHSSARAHAEARQL